VSLPIRRLIGLAERCVFGKQSLDSIHCGPTRLREQVPSRTGHPFFRSYGAILPSSFCKTHSSTLGSSPHLPVSVYGTGTDKTHCEVFLGSMIKTSWLALRLVSPSRLGVDDPPDLPGGSSYALRPAQPIAGWSFTSASPLSVLVALSVVQEYSPAFHRLRLSASPKGPTNPERINLPQETLGFRWTGFSPVFSLLVPA
jgi:hypothetical protein